MKDSLQNKELILKLFERLYEEFSFLKEHPENFPHKVSYLEDSGRYLNVLSGKLSSGLVGSKTIFVDEYMGITSADISALFPGDKQLTTVEGSYLTAFRCGLVAAYAVWRGGRLDSKIGFIGSGQINLMTAHFLAILGAKDFVLLGGRTNESKGERCFTTLTGIKFKTGRENIRDCNTLIVSTSNNEQKNMITRADAPKADFVLAQDGGYTLAKDWRVDFINFSDYPSQLEEHFEDEFPYDNRKKFKNLLFDLNMIRRDNKKVGVYLYGTIIADLVALEFYAQGTMYFKRLMDGYADAMKYFKK